MPDPIFADPRLAQIYDDLDPDRSDLDVYAAIVDEFSARRVLDVGCGTGTFACMLAARDVSVVGVDPAAASLAVARGKPHADRVHWILGDAGSVPDLTVDLAVMTGNVAQVFLTDDEWDTTLRAVRRTLDTSGRLVFETRVPQRRAWERWDRASTQSTVMIDGIGAVTSWCDVTDLALPFVSFRQTYEFAADGTTVVSDSTLRFREHDEVVASLERAGYRVDEVRDAPDRPDLEFVFVAGVRDEHPSADHPSGRA